MKPLRKCKLRTAGLASINSAMFGMTRTNADGSKRAHQGIDLIAAPNSDVLAVANGEVVGINRGLDGYGFTITLKINVENKTLYAFYAHLNQINVRVGLKLSKGQVLGLTGVTGNAKSMTSVERGAHLHFELREKQSLGYGLAGRIDPLIYVELDK
jgi:murein DD-endopeptidase MepM/ murein hydrolase activator NlpD